MKKIRVLLINLPIPDYYRSIQRGNTQLFGDYLRSLVDAEKTELLKLPREILEGYNNRALAAVILDLKPDIVGFSSYLWNIERNMDLSARLRQAGITTLSGGPEIAAENDYILADRFDFYFTGAGEYALAEFLDRYGEHKEQHGATIKSVKQIDFNTFLPGYLQHTDDYTYDKLFYLEVERGCPYKCVYCAYNKSNTQITSIDPVVYAESLKKIFTFDINEIYLLAPTLNRNRDHFNYYLDAIIAQKKQTGKQLKVFAELRAELVDETEITKMVLAGFREIEFGIQSLNKQVFTKLDRQKLRFDFIGFSQKLVAAGITPVIDFIVGLPHDSYENIIGTIELLDTHDLLSYANFYHLHVLANTELRKVFDTNDYVYDKQAPYLAYEVDTLDFNDIQEVYCHLEEEKDLTFVVDFFDYDPRQFYILKDTQDLHALENTPYYHTASFLFFTNFSKETIFNFFDRFFASNPDIFHKLFIFSNNRFDIDFLNTLNDMFCKYKNYYDLYKESINFNFTESFSKVLHVLVKPDVPAPYLEELNDNFLVDFVMFPEEMSFYEKYEPLFYLNHQEEGSMVYLFANPENRQMPWIRVFPSPGC
jgi:radical SAM superfamily enzyme YgiQ (UPF0313 family)